MDEALVICALEYLLLGDEEHAHATLEETLQLGRRQENKEYLARALCGLGRLALHRKELQDAHVFFEECVRVIAALCYIDRLQWVLSTALEGLGSIALARQQHVWAIHLFAAADARRSLQEFYTPLGREHSPYEQERSSVEKALGGKDVARLWQEGKTLSPLQALGSTQAKHMVENCGEREEGAACVQRDERAVSKKTHRTATRGHRPRPDAPRTGRAYAARPWKRHAQIAEELVLSVVTVNSYLRSIYSKLGVTSRTAATRYALDHHLLEQPRQ